MNEIKWNVKQYNSQTKKRYKLMTDYRIYSRISRKIYDKILT